MNPMVPSRFLPSSPSTSSSPCTLVAAALLTTLAASVASAELISLDLILDAPSSSANRIGTTITVSAPLISDSDTQNIDLSGNILASLDLDFTSAIPEASTLTFDGGALVASDTQFNFSFGFLGSAQASLTSVMGVPDTITPPGSVTAGTFDATEHQAELNQGVVDASGSIIAVGSFERTVDLSVDSFLLSGEGTGSVVINLLPTAGPLDTWEVVISLPVAINETIDVDTDLGATAVIVSSGVMTARGVFTHGSLIPGDANADGLVGLLDLDILGQNWQNTGVGFAEGDFNADGAVDLLDLDILGQNWGTGASSTDFATALAASGISIPEPATAGLLIGALAIGSTRRRHV